MGKRPVRVRHVHTLLLFWVAGLPACAREGADSLASPGTPWSVDTVPELVILDTLPLGEPRLLFPTGGTMLSHGVIVVADRWASAVRFFDRSGDLVRTVGRLGEGPGEFNAPSWLGQCGADSVFVWDYVQNQMSVIDSAGSVVREYTPTGSPSAFRCTRNGRFAVFGPPLQAPGSLSEAMVTRSDASLWIGDAAGDSTGGVGVLPFTETAILGKITQFAVTDQRIYVGTADSALVDIYGIDGGRVGAIPLSIASRDATESHYERGTDARLAFVQETEEREYMKEIVRRFGSKPPQLPIYTGLAVDPGGVIWVVLSSPGDGETRLQAVAEDGRVLADLTVPSELSLYEVGRDYLLGGFHGANDVPGIVVYRLQRGSP